MQSIQDKLRREVQERKITDPTEESFTKLPYLTAVVAELLRCYPSLPKASDEPCFTEAFLFGQRRGKETAKATFMAFNSHDGKYPG